MSQIASETQRQQIEKCFFLALHPSSDPQEIVAAIRGLHKLCQKYSGISGDDYFRKMSIPKADNDSAMGSLGLTSRELIEQSALRQMNERLRLENERMVAENERLRHAVDAAQNEKGDLQQEVESLRNENALLIRHAASGVGASKPIPVGGYYTFEEFSSALYAKLGTTKRALTIFSELTGTNFGPIQKWRRDLKVPASAFDMIDELDVTKAVKKVHQPMTPEQREKIDELSLEGLSDAKISDAMSKTYPDRMFNVNIIAGAKTQNRVNFLTKLRMDGKSKEEATLAFIQRYPRARKPEQMIDSIFS